MAKVKTGCLMQTYTKLDSNWRDQGDFWVKCVSLFEVLLDTFFEQSFDLV